MSLINDALKRAKQAQQEKPPTPAPGGPLRPVESARPASSAPGSLWPIAVVLLLLLVGAVVIWFAVARTEAKKPLAAIPDSIGTSTTPTTVATQPIPTPNKSKPAPAVSPDASPPKLPAFTPAPASGPTVVSPAVETAPAVAAVSATNVAAVAPEAPPALPKLQGILYRPNRPSALLNGKTVWIGGHSGEFLVVTITKQSVTVARAGQTNVLSLAE